MELYKIIVIIIFCIIIYKCISYKSSVVKRQGEVLPSKTKYPVSSSWKMIEKDTLPDHFLCGREKWVNRISGALQQNTKCGNCWSYASCGMVSDRIRLYDKNHLMFSDMLDGDLDYIDPEFSAKQLQCKGTSYCEEACQSQYIDDMFNFMKDGPGCLSKCTVLLETDEPKYKIESFYRVGSYNEDELEKDPSKISINEEQIMKEIFLYGPITATIKIYTSNDDRNLYKLNEDSRIYGDWEEGPPDTDDGYHSICILGWGVSNKGVKYWICRNSWGKNYGNGGLFKVLKGKNFAIIESDCFGAIPLIPTGNQTDFVLEDSDR